jgi:hypothetical protein
MTVPNAPRFPGLPVPAVPEFPACPSPPFPSTSTLNRRAGVIQVPGALNVTLPAPSIPPLPILLLVIDIYSI